MSRYDFRSPRLFVEAPLAAGAAVALDRKQTHYLRHVLRLKPSDRVLLFNGRDGEWLASLSSGNKAAEATLQEQTRPQTPAADLHYLFAPLKHERLDYMVQKAVEMGVSRLQPVFTQHTQVNRVNLERMRLNVIEAAEQCGVLAVPEVAEPLTFATAIAGHEPDRLLVFCDEDAEVAHPMTALAGAPPVSSGSSPGQPKPIAVLVGPEGGFSDEERSALLSLPHVVRLSLGPRILRADTAAVAALALVQAALGDWR